MVVIEFECGFQHTHFVVDTTAFASLVLLLMAVQA